MFDPRNTQVSLAQISAKLNPKIRGWLNYYSRFEKRAAANVFLYLNELIRKWVAGKFRLRSMKEVMLKYLGIVQSNNALFVHWQKGVKYWLNNKSRVKGDFQARFRERLKLKCCGLLDTFNKYPTCSNTRSLPAICGHTLKFKAYRNYDPKKAEILTFKLTFF